MNLKQHSVFPFQYDSWEEISDADYFYDVFFTDDFGRFKKGEHHLLLTIDFDKLVMEGIFNYQVTNSQSFKVVPV